MVLFFPEVKEMPSVIHIMTIYKGTNPFPQRPIHKHREYLQKPLKIDCELRIHMADHLEHRTHSLWPGLLLIRLLLCHKRNIQLFGVQKGFSGEGETLKGDPVGGFVIDIDVVPAELLEEDLYRGLWELVVADKVLVPPKVKVATLLLENITLPEYLPKFLLLEPPFSVLIIHVCEGLIEELPLHDPLDGCPYLCLSCLGGYDLPGFVLVAAFDHEVEIAVSL